jgi:hypothetical protein
VREVIVFLEPLTSLAENGVKLSPERTILDVFDFACQVDPAVPNLHWRQFGKGAHARPVGFDCFGRSCSCPLIGKPLCQRSYGDARRQSLDVDREVDARQGLIEVIDVEKDVLLRRGKGAEVHEVAIAARLNRNPYGGLMLQILRHHRRSAAQESERAGQHSLIADRYELRDAGAVTDRQNCNRVPIGRAEQIRVFFARRFAAQTDAPLVTVSKRARACLGHGDLSSDIRLGLCEDRI